MHKMQILWMEDQSCRCDAIAERIAMVFKLCMKYQSFLTAWITYQQSRTTLWPNPGQVVHMQENINMNMASAWILYFCDVEYSVLVLGDIHCNAIIDLSIIDFAFNFILRVANQPWQTQCRVEANLAVVCWGVYVCVWTENVIHSCAVVFKCSAVFWCVAREHC